MIRVDGGDRNGCQNGSNLSHTESVVVATALQLQGA